MKPTEFTALLLDLHNRYGEALGISDVYAYSALGRVIKAVGEVVISPQSPLVMNRSPRTLTMYLLSNGTVIAMVDLQIGHTDSASCGGETMEVTNDLYRPPSRFVAINITNCGDELTRRVGDVGRRFGVRLEVWFVKELGMENFKLGFRGSLSSLGQLVRLVVVMTVLSNVRSVGDIDKVISIIDDVLRRVRA